MESPKFSPEQRAWSADLVHRIAQQFPESHIREDAEHFIYDLTDRDGNHSEAHTPKWEKIPVQIAKDRVVGVPAEHVIAAELRHHANYGRDDWSLVEALRSDGISL